ncbi:MAG: carbohydrate ABC transporter permease [Armatimonadota bacterium]
MNAPPAAPRLGRRAREEARWAYLFILAPFVGFTLFGLGPLLASLVLSLFEYDLLGEPHWAGAANFRGLWSDGDFWTALRNSLFYLLGIPIGMALSLALALSLNRMRFAAFFRSLYFLPAVTSIVSVSLLWTWIYNPEFGWMNTVLAHFGVAGPAWLQDPKWVKPALILMGIWMNLGHSVLLYLAGLQSVPGSLLEAASLDGAGPGARFRHVVWPLLTPTTFFIAVTSVIGSLQMFGQIYLMTPGGGPDYSAATVMYYLWQTAFERNRMGYACAVAWVLGAMILTATLAQFAASRKWVHYSE